MQAVILAAGRGKRLKPYTDKLPKSLVEINGVSFLLNNLNALSKHNEKGKNVQHKGFGKNLLKEAEKLVQKNNINKISIISGVGVREYYEKNGYTLNNNTQYMEKYINTNIDIYYEYFIISLIILIMISMLFDLNVHSYLLKIHYNNDILKNLKNHSDL